MKMKEKTTFFEDFPKKQEVNVAFVPKYSKPITLWFLIKTLYFKLIYFQNIRLKQQPGYNEPRL